MRHSDDFWTVDLFDGSVRERRRVAVERRAVRSEVACEVVDPEEVCQWCGVDRAGGCGACSDLKAGTR